MTATRGLSITIASAAFFAIFGALAGLFIGAVAPDYYRIVFHLPPDGNFSTIQLGLGLGLTQGLVCGLAIGLVMVFAVTLQESNHKFQVKRLWEYEIFQTTTRQIAVGFFVLPLVLALPVRYWTFHLAGGWLVTTNLEPSHRAFHLGIEYYELMMTISSIAVFIGLLLLFCSNYRRKLIGWFLVPSTLLFLIGLIIVYTMISAYIQYA